jgi:hypothetical protein
MFFIGIFGIDHAVRDTGTTHTVVCPACGAWTQLQPQKEYDISTFFSFAVPLEYLRNSQSRLLWRSAERSGDS